MIKTSDFGMPHFFRETFLITMESPGNHQEGVNWDGMDSLKQ